jgi:hypothetical protein
MSGITSRLLCVSLNISQWQGRKLDKRETQELAVKHNLPNEAGRVYKTLLPMASSLDKVHKQTGKIRTYYYEHTVPWEYSRNALKAEGYIKFAQDMRDMIDEWTHYADDFKRQYPSLHAMAPSVLNGLYRAEDYPSPEQMNRNFNVELRFMPLPEVGNIVIEAADASEAEAASAAERELREELERGMTARYEAAMQDVWKRLYDCASKTHERLADPRNTFRDSLVDNARDLVRVLPSLNITNDPNLIAMAKQLDDSLCRHHPETLRQPGVTRAETAAKMADLMAKMGAFYTPEA